ncbi:MAG: amidohydrolase family protein [Spirochaetales bacterium]|nr:amidohydrolase family protein [Spirochaetales bacterium]
MIIDAHAHTGGEFNNPDNIIKILDTHGVAKVLLCPSIKNTLKIGNAPHLEIPLIKLHPYYGWLYVNPACRLCSQLLSNKGDGNLLVIEFARRYPDRIIPVFWINPNKENILEYIVNAKNKYNIKAIKFQQPCDNFSFNDNIVYQIAELCANLNIIIFVHPHSAREVKRFIDLVRAHPKTIFIMLHISGLEIINKFNFIHNNLYLEISPHSFLSKERIMLAYKKFGATHIIFGSDTPNDRRALSNNIKKISNMNFTLKEKELIFGANIARLLKLETN